MLALTARIANAHKRGPFHLISDKDGLALFKELDKVYHWSEDIAMDVHEGLYGSGAISKQEIPQEIASAFQKKLQQLLAEHRALPPLKQWEALKTYKNRGARGVTQPLQVLLWRADIGMYW